MEENPYAAPTEPPHENDEAAAAPLGMGQQERLGQWLVVLAIALMLCGDGFLIAFGVLRSGMPVSGASLFRFALTVTLLYNVWRGYEWARSLTGALLGLGCGVCVLALFRHMQPLVVAVAFQMAVCFVLLVFPSSVTAFLAFQRTRRAA